MKVKADFIFPGRLKEEAIICNLCQKFNIVLNIVEASFSTETGWAILIIESSPEELQNALAYLKDRGVEFRDIQEIP